MESMNHGDGLYAESAGGGSALDLPFHRIILDNASDPIFGFDRTGKYLYVNQAFAAPLNKLPDEIIGKRIWDIFPGEGGDQRFSAVRRVFETGEKNVIEVKVPRESEWLYYMTSVVPVKDSTGNVEIVICMSKDITSRKRAELSLRESEARYKGLFEDSGGAIGYYRPDGTIISYNKKAAENMGGIPEQYAGKSIRDLFPLEAADIYMARISRAVMTEGIQEYEDCVTLNHRTKWFSSIFHRIMDSDGGISGIQIISQDITQKKQTEERLQESQAILQAALDNSQAGIAIANAPDGKLRFVNKAGLLIRDNTEEEIVKNVGIDQYVASWNILHLDGTPYQPDEVPLSRAILRGDTCSEEFVIRRDDQEDHIVWANAAPVKDEHGRILAGIVVFLDVTDRKKTEEALLEAKKAAEVAANAKSRFLSNMSHEIRTPLNGILGMMQLLETTPLTEEQKEYVRLSKVSSDTLIGVIKDILDYSKMEAGKLVLEKIPFSPRAIVSDVVGLYKFDISKKQLLLESSVEEGIPEILLGDPFRLRQILTNLVGNAVKFTKEGRIDLFVGMRECHRNQSIQLVFSVTDTGIGIPGEKMDILFQSFSQVDNSDTRKYGGTGLGLAISKSLVELMGGEIWVESTEGKGSCFSFTCVSEIPPVE